MLNRNISKLLLGVFLATTLLIKPNVKASEVVREFESEGKKYIEITKEFTDLPSKEITDEMKSFTYNYGGKDYTATLTDPSKVEWIMDKKNKHEKLTIYTSLSGDEYKVHTQALYDKIKSSYFPKEINFESNFNYRENEKFYSYNSSTGDYTDEYVSDSGRNAFTYFEKPSTGEKFWMLENYMAINKAPETYGVFQHEVTDIKRVETSPKFFGNLKLTSVRPGKASGNASETTASTVYRITRPIPPGGNANTMVKKYPTIDVEMGRTVVGNKFSVTNAPDSVGLSYILPKKILEKDDQYAGMPIADLGKATLRASATRCKDRHDGTMDMIYYGDFHTGVCTVSLGYEGDIVEVKNKAVIKYVVGLDDSIIPVPPKPSSGVQERGKVDPIIFKPNETPWSNRGKISEGKGAYNTDVIYTGDLQIVYRGTVKSKERECSGSGEDRSCWWNYYEEDFEVVYDLDKIDVSGDAHKTFSGQSSDIDITHEGENLGLDAIGTWQPAKYHVPSMPGHVYSTIIPKEPPRPVGKSGDYDIDWTMPTIEIDKIAHDRAIDSLTFGIDIDDNLEPDECLTVTAPTEYGVDGTLDNQNKSHRNITYNSIPNEDTVYEFHYDIEDEATNKRFCSFKTSIVKEYWEQMIKIIGKDLDLEVPIKFLSNSDTQTLKGFKRSKTINFDSWRGIPTEVWYKFTGKTVNFIRVIHYNDPKLPIIDENGNKLYPTDTEFKDSPGLANKIGVDVGSNMEITNYGRLSLQTPVKTVDNEDGTITNYYMNGDVRTIDKATGKVVQDKQKGYGEILNDLTEHIGNKTIYRTGNRYIITITDCGSYSDMLVQDRNLNTVEHTKINK